MGILNLQFAILCGMFAVCILPGVFGIYLLSAGEDSRNDMRRWVCTNLFGVSNAFSLEGFTRFLKISGSIMLAFSLVATAFFVYFYLG